VRASSWVTAMTLFFIGFGAHHPGYHPKTKVALSENTVFLLHATKY
jgi:hypothetical protein